MKYSPIFTIKLVLSLILLISFKMTGSAQPYLDIINARRLQSKLPGSNSADVVEIAYNNLSATIPIQLKDSPDAFIISPYFENWDLSFSDRGSYNVRGWVVPISFLKSIRNTKWTVLPTLIVRSNKELHQSTSGNVQYGAAVIASYKRKANLIYKFGLYYNKEFFGNFFMPLAGIDWRINDKNNLFGVLPGNMMWEHKVTKSFYYGLTFRAVTNSYRIASNRYGLPADTKTYLRIDDNHLAAFADLYLSKSIVLNAEAGHSISRKFRFGVAEKSSSRSRIIYHKDNLFLKASFAYRIRFK